MILHTAQLSRMMQDVAAPESGRYALNGIYVRAEDRQSIAVSCNGYSLAKVVYLSREAGNGEMPRILSGEHFRAITKALPKRKKMSQLVTVSGSNDNANAVTLSTAETVIETPTLAGNYPDYESCIPQDQPTASVHLNAAALIRLLRVAQDIADENKGYAVDLEIHGEGQPIVLKTKNDKLTFTGVLMPMHKD